MQTADGKLSARVSIAAVAVAVLAWGVAVATNSRGLADRQAADLPLHRGFRPSPRYQRLMGVAATAWGVGVLGSWLWTPIGVVGLATFAVAVIGLIVEYWHEFTRFQSIDVGDNVVVIFENPEHDVPVGSAGRVLSVARPVATTQSQARRRKWDREFLVAFGDEEAGRWMPAHLVTLRKCGKRQEDGRQEAAG